MKSNVIQTRLSVGPFDLTVQTIRNFTQESELAAARLSGKGEGKSDHAPYYGLVWESARTLAQLIAEGPSLEGKTYLEVGCGLAVPSMIAAKKGATVVATDFHPDAKGFVEENLRLNGLDGSPRISYVEANWRDLKELASSSDCVIGSDILYDAGKADTLGDFMAEAFKAGVKEAIIVDAGRPYIGAFKKRCEGHGLTVAESTHEVQAHGKSVKTVVMTVTK